MAFPVPRSLSPSKVSSFTDCALAFRFSVIDRLPEPPSPAATRGTLVHAALERLHLLPPDDRTVDAALACLEEALAARLRSGLKPSIAHSPGLDLELCSGLKAASAPLTTVN